MSNTDFSAVEADWAVYRSQGAALYAAVTAGQGRLLAALELVRHLARQPVELKKELPGLLLLLESARAVPALREAVVQLTATLNPWLDRMDDWPRWEAAVRYAADSAAQLGLAELRAQFLIKLAHILLHSGRVEEAAAVITEALAAARQGGAAVALARAAAAAVEIRLVQSDEDNARALLAAIQSDPILFNAVGETQAAALAYIGLSLAVVQRHSGALDPAVQSLNEAVAWLEPFPDADPYLAAVVFRVRGVYQWAKGRTDAALPDLKQAARQFMQLGDQYGLAMTFANLGLVYRSIGRLDAAETTTRYAISAAKQWDARWLMAREIGNLGLVSLFQGRLKEAERLVKRHLKLATRLGIDTEVGRAKGNLGVIYLHQGRYEAALDLLEWDRAVSETRGKLEGLAVACANLGRCYFSLGHFHRAEAEARRALTLAEQLGSASLRVMALRALAETLPPPQARQVLEQAYALAEGMRFDRTACRLALAALETDAARRARLWDVGRRQLMVIGAAAWLNSSSLAQPPRLPALM